MAEVVKKLWYQSKTLWVNFFLFIGSLAEALNFIDLDLTPEAAWIGVAISVLYTILRLVTGKEITFS